MLSACTAVCASNPGAPVQAVTPGARNVIIFIADGLRHDSVTAQDAPTLLAARVHGVHFINSHALFPTLTMANAAALATAHGIGDTGIFSNTEYVGFGIFSSGAFGKAAGTPTPFLENDQALADVDDRFPGGNFLNETSLLAVAHAHGFNTAAIGKLGPVAIQDLTRIGTDGSRFLVPQTVVLDDSTGTSSGLPLSAESAAALGAAGLQLAPPARRQPTGSLMAAGTLETNAAQQKWLVDATTRAILPAFVRSGKPFVLVYWSRDPDGTQHNQGDSLNTLTPGINGPTSHAAVADADANLKQILDLLDSNPGLRSRTDVLITSDHGFATISKHEIDAHGGVASGYSTTFTYRDAHAAPEVAPGWLPPGFLAIDLAHALDLPLFDSDAPLQSGGVTRYVAVDPSRPASEDSRQRPTIGSALIPGSALQSRGDAKVIVAANGGSDLIYVPGGDRRLVRRIVEFLAQQDYTGALFVHSAFGSIPGALPLASIGLEGTARMPQPSIVVAFKTFLRVPGDLHRGEQVADTTLQEGQGSHGSFGRDNTYNNMAAIGPDFKQGFVDWLPVSNADIARTAAHILGLRLPRKGKLQGRVLAEALAGRPGKSLPPAHTQISAASTGGKATVLQLQLLDGSSYFDAACFVPAGELQHTPLLEPCTASGN